MDDRRFVKQLSSVRLQKAINKNQTIDSDLKKELQSLEVKKRASQKAFEQKKTQFLRARLCLEPLRKSQSFHLERPSHGRLKPTELLDLRTSYSTGNLLEWFLSSIKDPFCETFKEASGKLFEENFSLDTSKESPAKPNCLKYWRGTFGKLNEPHLEKSYSCNDTIYKREERKAVNGNGTKENGYRFGDIKIRYSASGTSFCYGGLTGRQTRPETLNVQRLGSLKQCDASYSVKMPPIATEELSKSEGSTLKRVKNPCKGRKHLSLPPLRKAWRSKSLETVRVSRENNNKINSEKERRNADTNAQRKKLSWSVIEVDSKKNSWTPQDVDKQKMTGCEMNVEPEVIEKSTSTPDLLDIGPDVEYLLLKDDKTRLRRMRASVQAIRLMENIKGYRYIRNVEFTSQKKQETKLQKGEVSGTDQLNNAQMAKSESGSSRKPNSQNNEEDSTGSNGECLVNSPPEPTNLESSRCNSEEELCNATNEDGGLLRKGELEEDSLTKSSASSLADMFDELKHTRYLRNRPKMTSEDLDNDDDDDGDNDDDYTGNALCGFRIPMIIVGHTNAVLAPKD